MGGTVTSWTEHWSGGQVLFLALSLSCCCDLGKVTSPLCTLVSPNFKMKLMILTHLSKGLLDLWMRSAKSFCSGARASIFYVQASQLPFCSHITILNIQHLTTDLALPYSTPASTRTDRVTSFLVVLQSMGPIKPDSPLSFFSFLLAPSSYLLFLHPLTLLSFSSIYILSFFSCHFLLSFVLFFFYPLPLSSPIQSNSLHPFSSRSFLFPPSQLLSLVLQFFLFSCS